MDYATNPQMPNPQNPMMGPNSFSYYNGVQNPMMVNNPMMPMTPEQYQAYYNQMMQMNQMGMANNQYPVNQYTAPQVGPVMPQPAMNQYAAPQMNPVQIQTQTPMQPMQQTVEAVTPSPFDHPLGNEPMMVGNQINPMMMQRDPNILNYMADVVREKNKGTAVTEQFVADEANKLYDQFGESLVDTFEKMLNEEQIKKFDEMLEAGATQNQLLEYMMGCIPDLTAKIEESLLKFREKYMMKF